MRIKNWKEEPPQFTLPVVGRIKNGRKVEGKNGKTYPTALDHFIAKCNNPLIEKAFQEKLGEPQRLIIAFLSDDDQESCSERMIIVAGGKLVATTNGQVFKIWNRQKKDWVIREVSSERESQQLMAETEQHFGLPWKQQVTLKFFIPALPEVFGFWIYETTAESMRDIVKIFDTVKATAGTVIGIPFELSTTIHNSFSENGRKYPVVSLMCDLSTTAMKMLQNGKEQVMLSFREGGFRILDESSVRQITEGATQRAIEAPRSKDQAKATEVSTEDYDTLRELVSELDQLRMGELAALAQIYRRYEAILGSNHEQLISLCREAKERILGIAT